MFYGSENDNSYVGDIVRFIDGHPGLKPFEKDLFVNRLTVKSDGNSEEMKVAQRTDPIPAAQVEKSIEDDDDHVPSARVEAMKASELVRRLTILMQESGSDPYVTAQVSGCCAHGHEVNDVEIDAKEGLDRYRNQPHLYPPGEDNVPDLIRAAAKHARHPPQARPEPRVRRRQEGD